MHRTSVLRGIRLPGHWGRHWLGVSGGMQIFFRIGFELCYASFGAEVVNLSLIGRFPSGVRRIDRHSTDWIDGAGRLLKDWKHSSLYRAATVRESVLSIGNIAPLPGYLRRSSNCCDNLLR